MSDIIKAILKINPNAQATVSNNDIYTIPTYLRRFYYQ